MYCLVEELGGSGMGPVSGPASWPSLKARQAFSSTSHKKPLSQLRVSLLPTRSLAEPNIQRQAHACRFVVPRTTIRIELHTSRH